MIKVGKPDYERIFDVIKILTDGTSVSSGENWKPEVEERNPLKIATLTPNAIELPLPLEYLGYSFSRRGDSLELLTTIHAKTKTAFNNLSYAFRKELAARDLLFHPTSPHLTGYILNMKLIRGKTITPLAIILENKDPHSRIIGAGTFGARQLKFKDVEELTLDIGQFNSYVNTLIGCIYKREYKTQDPSKTVEISLDFPPL